MRWVTRVRRAFWRWRHKRPVHRGGWPCRDFLNGDTWHWTRIDRVTCDRCLLLSLSHEEISKLPVAVAERLVRSPLYAGRLGRM